MYADDQDENKPPVGLVQQQEHRQLAGILKPATNVPYLPLEDQQTEIDEEGMSEGGQSGKRVKRGLDDVS